MMKKNLFFLIFLLNVFPAMGQTLQDLQDLGDKILKQRIITSPENASKVNLLLALGRNVLFKPGVQKSNIDTAYQLMKEAEKLSYQLKDGKSQGKALLLGALIANKKGDTAKGLSIARQAFSKFKSLNDPEDEAEAYIVIGQHYDEEKRIFYYNQAVILFQQAGSKERLATTLVDLADILSINREFELSLKDLRMALAIYHSINYNQLTNLYDNMGVDLARLGDLVDGLKYELLALRCVEDHRDTTLQLCAVYNKVAFSYFMLKDYKQSNSYCDKGLVIAQKYADSDYMFNIIFSEARNYNKMNMAEKSGMLLNKIRGWLPKTQYDGEAGYYSLSIQNLLALKEYKEARRSLDSLPPIDKVIGFTRSSVIKCFILYYTAIGKFTACLPYLQKNDSIAKKDNNPVLKASNELEWFKVDSGVHKYKDAITHYQRFKTITDSVFSLDKNKQTALLQFEFDTEKKDQDLLVQAKNIQLLKQKAEIKANQARLNQRLYLAGFGALTLVFGIGYNRFRLKQRSNLQLQQKQHEINAQNRSLKQLVYEKDDLLKDKDWLLKEVHHRVKNNLQIVMSLLSTQSAFLKNTAAKEAIKESQNRVNAISMLHQKLYKNTNLTVIPMQSYISDLVENLSDCFGILERGINFKLDVENVELDLAQAVPLGLILNEAITNAIKYAFTSDSGCIAIRLQLISEAIVSLQIKDNGKGLPAGFDMKTANSLGMEMMKALSKQLGATIHVISAPSVAISVDFQLRNILNAIEYEFYED